MALGRFVAASAVPLSADEAYYWLWTRPLQLSYLDHPAMVATWIWGGTHLLGDSVAGVRLFAPLASLAVTALVWDAARRAFASRAAANQAAIWLNAALMFNLSGILITPDSPLLLFWSLCLWAMVRLTVESRPWHLLTAGLAGGLACLSKYTGLLMAPGLIAVLVAFPGQRRSWRHPAPYVGLALAALCATPLIAWNAANGWASFAKQFDHAFDNPPPLHPAASALGFLGSQIGLVTPILFAFVLAGMAWALWAGWRQGRAAWFLLGATSLPVVVFFLVHAATATVQAHWAGPAYLGGIAAAAGASTAPRWRRWRNAATILGAVMSIAVVIQAATGWAPIPKRFDPLKRLGGWPDLAAAVDAERVAHPGIFLLTEKHEPTGIVSFLLPDHPTVFLTGPIRPSYYRAEAVESLKGRDGLFITRTRSDASASMAEYFTELHRLGVVPLRWRGSEVDSYTLYLGIAYRGGALTKGDGWRGASDSASEAKR